MYIYILYAYRMALHIFLHLFYLALVSRATFSKGGECFDQHMCLVGVYNGTYSMDVTVRCMQFYGEYVVVYV